MMLVESDEESSHAFGVRSFSEEEFAELVQGLVDDHAPRVFALVEEIGERLDGGIFAWGLEFGDWAAVFRTERRFIKCASAASAHGLFARAHALRLVWPSLGSVSLAARDS